MQPAGFCMGCGPQVPTYTDPAEEVLRCTVCGWRRRLAARPLYVVAGVSGSGKSSVADRLPQLLPECAVFDGDLTLHIAELGWNVWRDTWLQLAHSIALCGRITVLCGTFSPEQFAGLPSRPLVAEIEFCLLDAPAEVIGERLRSRPPWREWDESTVAGQQAWARRLRRQIGYRIDTGSLDENAVAAAVAAWVQGCQSENARP